MAKYKSIVILGPDNPGQDIHQKNFEDLAQIARDASGEVLIIGNGKDYLTLEDVVGKIDPSKIHQFTDIELFGHGLNESGEHYITIISPPNHSTRSLIKAIDSIRPDLSKSFSISACFAGAAANCVDELTKGSVLLSRGPEDYYTFIQFSHKAVIEKIKLRLKQNENNLMSLLLNSFVQDSYQSCFYSIKLLDGVTKKYHFNLSIDDLLTNMSLEQLFVDKVRSVINDLLKEGDNLPPLLRTELTEYLDNITSDPMSRISKISNMLRFDKLLDESSFPAGDQVALDDSKKVELQKLFQKEMDQKKLFFNESIAYNFIISKEKISDLVKKTVPRLMSQEALFDLLAHSSTVSYMLGKAIKLKDIDFIEPFLKKVNEDRRLEKTYNILSSLDPNLTAESLEYLIDTGLELNVLDIRQLKAAPDLWARIISKPDLMTKMVASNIANLPDIKSQQFLLEVDSAQRTLVGKVSTDRIKSLIEVANKGLSVFVKFNKFKAIKSFLMAVGVEFPEVLLKDLETILINVDNIQNREARDFLRVVNESGNSLKELLTIEQIEKAINFKNDRVFVLDKLTNFKEVNKFLASMDIKLSDTLLQEFGQLKKEKKREISNLIDRFSDEVKRETGIDLSSCQDAFGKVSVSKASELISQKDLIIYAANKSPELFQELNRLCDNGFPDSFINIFLEQDSISASGNKVCSKLLEDNFAYYKERIPRNLVQDFLVDKMQAGGSKYFDDINMYRMLL